MLNNIGDKQETGRNCPYCAGPRGLHIATTCIECNRRFFEEADDVDMIRLRGAWLQKFHPEVAGEIRAMWKRQWKARK